MNLTTDQSPLLLLADLQREKEALRARVAELEAALQFPQPTHQATTGE